MTDRLLPLLLLLRYMHILGAITLMGGAIFMRFALRPVVVHLQPEVKTTIHDEVRRRWSRFVMLATLLLLVSGIANLGLAARYDFEPVLGTKAGYSILGGIKLLLALPIFFIAAILTGRTETARRFQAKAEWWINVNLTLALTMVLIGGVLKFIRREPKQPTDNQAAATAPSDQIASQKLPFRATGE